MIDLTYITRSGTRYSFRNGVIAKDDQPLDRAIYLESGDANEIYQESLDLRRIPENKVFTQEHYQFPDGKILFILGENSIGKSLRVISRDPPFEITVSANNLDN